MASAIGLASWKPRGIGARGRLRHLARRRPARTPALCCVQPRGRATKAASPLLALLQERLRALLDLLFDFTGTPFRGQQLGNRPTLRRTGPQARRSTLSAPGQMASGSVRSIHTVTVRPGLYRLAARGPKRCS